MVQQMAQVGKLLIGVWMAGVAAAMFLIVPQYEGLGNAGRIIIMHVPTAWVSVLAFALSAIFSGLYLWRRKPAYDDYALAAAEGGFLFTALATITGMIFSEVVWGVFWNWDPRQTSIFVLLLIYAALFALRSAIDDPQRRRQLSAVYALFAFVTVPFLVFVAPRMAESTLHPNCVFIQGSHCDGITLAEGRIGLLGDHKLHLLELERQGDVVTAHVLVGEPGLARETLLRPSFNLATGTMMDRPEFPGVRYQLGLERVDLASNSALLNIEAPGTGVLANRTTLYTFLASTTGFTALFIWMLHVRATLLGIAWTLAQREGVRL
ncbi:cytochrome c biogenesis protein [Candidatus Viridilinea mediisalina]|uniref:Heme exporter protein C n=1 Tax=Candidatus Viridilinea mediisalina TaxID=2024553 RepID=A0A2A6RIT9_9CHLR|nr:cytochrome c biogenesis protein [Candidatus Viridilinea mediisalina]PDW02760.1 cytochrome C biogenesis protein [Candidatus Viridilinea mediisalina]